MLLPSITTEICQSVIGVGVRYRRLPLRVSRININIADKCIDASISFLFSRVFPSNRAPEGMDDSTGLRSLSTPRTRCGSRTKGGAALPLFADLYLSRWHRDNPGEGCTMAALAQEVARSTPELKAAFEQGIENMLSAKSRDRKEAIFWVAALIGGVVLARAVQDPRLSDEILSSVQEKLG